MSTRLLALLLGGCFALAAADFSTVPGTIITHQPASTGIFLGSPGLVVLPDGTYLAKCDEFGPQSTENSVAVTRVYRSRDRGQNWAHVVTVSPMYWASIFTQRDAVYLLGNAKQNGDIVIMRSIDGGTTWTSPKDDQSGLLFPGRFHCAPVPVIEHNGRLWRAMEDTDAGGNWGKHFRARVMSAPVGADLLAARNWTLSEPVAPDFNWLDGQFGGWLEGNVVVAPGGELLNLMRVHHIPAGGKAAALRVSPDGKSLAFDGARDFIDFPGGAKKFQIRWDEVGKCYWALANWGPPSQAHKANADKIRNTLALLRSTDLRSWEVRCALIHHPDQVKHGYQYPDFLIEGDDLIAMVRTAHDDGLGGARNQHDANFMTFHRWPNFRQLTAADSVPALREEVRQAAGSGLRLRRDGHWLVIAGAQIPGGEIRINYLEAYCRANSTDADWVEHTVIRHRNELVSASPDGREIRLRDTLTDGVVVNHLITAGVDDVTFELVAHNPTDRRSEAHWAQPCVRLGAFTGFDADYSRGDLNDYLSKCFIFLPGAAAPTPGDKSLALSVLTRMPTPVWETKARYTPGQVWAAPGVPRTDVNPRPLNPQTPANGLIGCFSGDETMIFATAWEPYQELFQGVARCLHSDFRLGGLEAGETKRIKGKIYVVPNDVAALLARYGRDFPNASRP